MIGKLIAAYRSPRFDLLVGVFLVTVGASAVQRYASKSHDEAVDADERAAQAQTRTDAAIAARYQAEEVLAALNERIAGARAEHRAVVEAIPTAPATISGRVDELLAAASVV